MSKFSYEEKIRAVQLVEAGETIGCVSRQTGISRQVIQYSLPDQQHLKSCLFGNKETGYILEDHLLRILIICKLPY